MNDILGFISSIAFAVMAVPQIIKMIQTKNPDSTTNGFLVLNYIGNIFAFVYVAITDIETHCFHLPLYCNYSVATINLIVLTYLKHRYSKNVYIKCQDMRKSV